MSMIDNDIIRAALVAPLSGAERLNFPSSPVGFLLHDVARLMRRRFEQRAAALGFTRAQWQVLLHLSRNEGIHQAGLAEILEVEPISLVRILDKLQARGLVERRQDAADRRCWRLYLTPDAHPSLALLQDIGEQNRAEALAGIGPAELDALISTLTILKTNLVDALTRQADDDEAQHG
jgi:MarR family transcriptional regulator, transcriptional regulator for hemolysin